MSNKAKKNSPLSLRNWKQFQEESGQMAMLGYWQASKDNVDKLNHILEKSRTLKELKKNLVSYVENRDTFVRRTSDNIFENIGLQPDQKNNLT